MLQFDFIFVPKPFRAQSLYNNINQILIRFLQSKLISNSFSMKTNSFLRANNPYLELCKIMIYLHLSFLLQDLSVTLFLRSQYFSAIVCQNSDKSLLKF